MLIEASGKRRHGKQMKGRSIVLAQAKKKNGTKLPQGIIEFFSGITGQFAGKN